MTKRKIPRVRLRRAIAGIAALGALTLVTCIGWFVLGPASRISDYSEQGIPNGAAPRLTATEIRDLPLSCELVATGGTANADGDLPYRNHAYLARYDGRYFVMFSRWYGVEDQPGSIVEYATSNDGTTWTEPKILAEPVAGHGIIARGFVERDGKLFAWHATHTGDTFFRNGKRFANSAEHREERNIAILESEWLGDGRGWRPNRVVLEGFLNNYSPRRFGQSQMMAVRDQDRVTYLARSVDGDDSWQLSEPLPRPDSPPPGLLGMHLPDEPVVMSYEQDSAHVILRNNNTEDRRLWAAELVGGEWQEPYPLPFPSDASKFLPLELADGRTALIGNFEPDVHRALLNMAISSDASTDYDTIFRLAPEGQISGLLWRSPQYPHAIVSGDTLMLAFALSKRDISVCAAPATLEGLEAQSSFELMPRLFKGLCNRGLPKYVRRALGYAVCREHLVWG